MSERPEGMSRAQFLKLMGGVGVAGSLAACGDSGPARQGSVEPVLIDNVRGYTIVDGSLRKFDSLLVNGDGRVESLDAGNAGGARRIDGRGRVCLPGMHDAHGHIWNFGARATQLDLTGTKSLDDAIGALKRYAEEHPEQQWIRGRGWNEVIWGLGRLPTAADLDRVVSDRPVWLVRVDGHAAVTNTAGLKAAGVVAGTPDPPGGSVVRGPDGQPTGAFIDTAKALVEAKLPPVNEADHRQRLAAVLERLNKAGLTSVSDAGTGSGELKVLREQSGSLSLRVNVFLSWQAFTEVGPSVRTDSEAGDRIRIRTVKLYADGALGSRGAALIEPYSDAPGSSGLLQLSAEELDGRVKSVIDAGYQCAVHAIGDKGNRVVLEAYEKALRGRPDNQLRHRIEHAQVIAVADIPRFKALGLIASMQPVHATEDMNMAESRVGPARIAGAYAWRTLLDQGTVIAAGSDFPVSPETPFDGMHAAVTRTDRQGKPVGGWFPAQAMTPVEALRAFTLSGAYAAHQERSLGSLEPGKHADFIVVDQDPFAPDSGRALWQTTVLQTWLGGRRVGEYGQL